MLVNLTPVLVNYIMFVKHTYYFLENSDMLFTFPWNKPIWQWSGVSDTGLMKFLWSVKKEFLQKSDFKVLRQPSHDPLGKLFRLTKPADWQYSFLVNYASIKALIKFLFLTNWTKKKQKHEMQNFSDTVIMTTTNSLVIYLSLFRYWYQLLRFSKLCRFVKNAYYFSENSDMLFTFPWNAAHLTVISCIWQRSGQI